MCDGSGQLETFAKQLVREYAMRMEKIELSEKLLKIAGEEGLSAEQLQELLSGGQTVPQDLMDLFGNIAERTTDFFSDED